jgi:pyruvate formate lyase activating enzyme
MNMDQRYTARWWHSGERDKIVCTLCPRFCQIGEGQTGFCFIRYNEGGKLYSSGYGHPTGFGVDPIEKKPLNHFLPGTTILSFGTAGCNLGCKFCQNWSISKARLDDIHSLTVSPENIIELALKHHTPSIAFTYNEPTIFGEYVADIAALARQENIKCVMVTNGYITREARGDVYRNIDAANVDLKAFSERFYHKITSAHLNDVLDTLVWLKRETAVWFEITTLLIPGENDAENELEAMSDWILNNLGDSVPIHFTAFHPDFKMTDRPPTPAATLRRAREIALKAGIKFCYIGNVHDTTGQTTFCPGCGTALIKRDWHSVTLQKLHNGACPECHIALPGRWTV